MYVHTFSTEINWRNCNLTNITMICYNIYQYTLIQIMQSLPSKTILPEHLTSWLFFQRCNKDQKSMPDSVGICLIFSWQDKAQEQPNIKHITQPLASQSLSRLEKPVADKRDNAMRINKGVTVSLFQTECRPQTRCIQYVSYNEERPGKTCSTQQGYNRGAASREGVTNNGNQRSCWHLRSRIGDCLLQERQVWWEKQDKDKKK